MARIAGRLVGERIVGHDSLEFVPGADVVVNGNLKTLFGLHLEQAFDRRAARPLALEDELPLGSSERTLANPNPSRSWRRSAIATRFFPPTLTPREQAQRNSGMNSRFEWGNSHSGRPGTPSGPRLVWGPRSWSVLGLTTFLLFCQNVLCHFILRRRPDQEVGLARSNSWSVGVLEWHFLAPLLNQAYLLTCSHILMRPYLHAAVSEN